MPRKNHSTFSNKTPSTWLILGVILAFFTAAGFTAFLAFETVRDMILSSQSNAQTGFLPDIPTSVGNEDTNPVTSTPRPKISTAPISVPTANPWDGANRVTILVIGLDARDWLYGEGPPRTDTMVLLTIDPISHTAGGLFIPRDLWVEIPNGFGFAKINTAYPLGEAYQLPGGGPGLAIETVQNLLGVPINYYAQIDFGAFIQFVDEIGGVKLDIPEEIEIDLIGPEPPKTLYPGIQTLPGEWALAYARMRGTAGGDFDRAQRTLSVILGIRDRILNFKMAPTLIAKSKTLYEELSSGITTNIPLQDAIELGLLALQIPRESLIFDVIGPSEVSFGTSPEGLQILKPIPDQIRILRNEVFKTESVISTGCQEDQPDCVQGENANVGVYNGTYSADLATRTADYLRGLSINVVDTGNAPQTYISSTIIDYTGNPYTIEYLMRVLNIAPTKFFSRYDPNSTLDVEVFLGTDWAINNSLPK